MTKVWDNHKVIGEINKTANTKIVVAIATRDGVKYVHLHEWYMKKSDPVWRPGYGGLTLQLGAIGNVLELLAKAKELLATFELSDPTNAVYKGEK